ncbi:MAG: PAS domain S-box protein [Armatimonadota bacterium]
MINSEDRSKQSAETGNQAKKLPPFNADLCSKDPSALTLGEISQILYQLRACHTELEMQNEELRRAKLELDTARARYFDLYELAPVGYCTVSEKGIILEANLTAVKLLATTREHLIKRPISQFIMAEDQDIFYLHRKQLFESGEPQVCELRMMAQDSSFWVRLEATTAQEHDGSAVYRLVISDITKHQLEELALQDALAEAQCMRDALDHDPSYVFMKDTKGCYIYGNQRVLELFGCTAEGLVGSDDSRFFPQETVCQIRELDARVFAGEQSAAEVDVPDAGAGRHVYWEVKTPIYADPEHTTVSGLLGIVTDITERKQFEEVRTFLAGTSSGTAVEPFFNALARYLAETLGMDFVCVDRLEGDGLSARTVAVWCDGQFEDNVTYALADTPCGQVVGKTVCCFPASVCSFFPRDQVLEDLHAESYVGVTLWSHTGEPIGLIAVIGRKTLANRKLAEDVLKLVGVRAAAELERLDVEESLRASEDRFRSLFETAPLGYQSLNEEGYFIEVNQAWLDTLGYQRDEVMGRWFGDFLAPEYVDAFRRRFPVFKAMGQIHSEFMMLHKEGTHRYIAFEGRVGYQPDGVTFKQTHCILTDITEHKQAEVYHVMSIDVLKILNNSAPFPETIKRVLGSIKSHTGFDAVGIRLQDGDDYPYYVQDGFSSDFLLTENSLIERGAGGGVCRDCEGNISLECTCGLVISGKTDPTHPLMTRGGSFWVNDSFPLLELTPDQEPRNRPRNTCIHQNYASVALVPINIQETIVGLIQLNDKRKGRFTLETVEMMEGIAAHIGSAMMRIQAEAKLKQSDDWHRTILQTAMDGFLLANMQGQVLDVNEAYCRMSGYSAQELLSMRISDLEAIDTEGEIDARHDQLIKQGEMRFESQHRRKDGTICDLEISIKYDPTGDGQIVVFYHDITARKKAEEERAGLEAQLQQAQKMETVGRLAGGVAHDFNNMLGVIIGHTQMAIEGVNPTSPLYDDLTEIRLAAERSAELTRQLLAFARKQTVMPKELDLNETIEGMLRMLERMIGENVQLMWKPSADLWRVKMDPSQINQILTNLCVNARDAIADVGKLKIETGNITIDDPYCAGHVGFEPGDYVRLTVSDSGCGMDKNLLDHVFEPFFTTKGVGEGTGLGLSSVYGAVKQNGGFINVYSELGHGTIFTIYIPRHNQSSSQLQEGIAAAPNIRGHETILLVEDEPSILRLAKKMLERLGYTVITAATPGEATELAEKHHGEINLLLTDVVMPEMNGRDLAKNLLSLYPGMGRLFMSGYTSDVIAHQGKVEEGMYFIQKPFSMSELSAMVRHALGE